MKRILAGTLLACALLAPRPAAAQIYGQYVSAETVPTGGHLFGGYLHAGQGFLGLMTQLRLSFYPSVDFGFDGGLTRIDVGTRDLTTLRVGTDVKFLVSHGGRADVSLGGALGIETGDHLHVLSVGPTLVVSHAFSPGARAGVTPYAGIGLVFSSAEISSNQFTDFSVPFRLGSEFRLAPELRLMAEMQLRASDDINDDFSFVTGVNLPF